VAERKIAVCPPMPVSLTVLSGLTVRKRQRQRRLPYSRQDVQYSRFDQENAYDV
jgi:hypothetical protein